MCDYGAFYLFSSSCIDFNVHSLHLCSGHVAVKSCKAITSVFICNLSHLNFHVLSSCRVNAGKRKTPGRPLSSTGAGRFGASAAVASPPT